MASMEIVPKDIMTPVGLPLPLGQSFNLAEAQSIDGDVFSLVCGLNEELIKAFKERSCDESDIELQKFSSDATRICKGSYEKWYAKERYPFALVHADGRLAGLVWFGPKEFPVIVSGMVPEVVGAWDTFSVRMYTPFRGKGLATAFVRYTIEAYRAMRPGHPLWLDTDPMNEGAIRLFKKLGFVEVGYTDYQRLVMMQE